MGRVNPVLYIVVAAEWRGRSEILELEHAGHKVTTALSPGDPVDLILHPAAHQWNDMMWDYLPAALVAARRRKKEAKR